MPDGQHPEFIFYNGDVRTMNPAQPQATAVFVRGGRVHAVGDDAQLFSLVGPSTQRVDLRGNTLMPGLVDAHCHPTKGAIADLFSCKFEFTDGPDELAASLHASIAAAVHSDWIVGGRWDSDFFKRFPMVSPRAWLDEQCAGRPVYLRDDSGHNGWANSAALEQCGFTVKLHTAGGRSVRVALDAIEAAHAISGRDDLRHELAHAGFVDPNDVPRFRRLNVVADLSP